MNINYSDIRREARETMRNGKWLGKYVVLWIVLVLFASVVNGLWNAAVKAYEIQTWGMFLAVKWWALMSGLDVSVPSRTIMYQMHMATLFDAFIGCIVSGICTYAISCMMLRAAQGKNDRWLGTPLGALARPLDMAWLYFRYCLQVWLWSLLLVIPGFIAAYRYAQCWNLKVDHPEWSAGKCLAESGALMRGNKWHLFCLHCSYWRPITLLLLVMMAMSICLVEVNWLTTGIFFVLSLIGISLALFVMVYFCIGSALFYRKISA